MNLRLGVLASAVALFSAHAQFGSDTGFDTGQISSDPAEAAKQIQLQNQFAFENQIADTSRGTVGFIP